MKIRHTLIYFFFLTLRDRNTDLINAENLVRTGTEGGNITVGCSFTFSGRKKLFCKKECEGKDILVETTGDRAQSGRYSIEYKEGSYPVYSTHLYVSIRNLTKSDSGRYRCGLDRIWKLDSYKEFEIRVKDAPITSKPNLTLRPSSTSVPSASTLTTTQSFSSSSGSSTPSSASPEATKQPEQQQTTPAAGPGSVSPKQTAQTTTGVLLYVGVILVVMIIVLSAAVLIFCRKRASKPKERPEETEYANVTQANRVYEEVREDRQSRSPPVEISTVYTCAKYTKPNGVETTDDYSFVTAVSPQNKTDNDSNKLTYSEVNFSKGPAASLNSAPRGDADNVIYSVPRVEASPAEDASAPLYSTVNLHQQ